MNVTFTGGGIAAPIFAVLYVLPSDEMPNDDDIITVPIPGLTVAGDQNIYNSKEGYIIFGRQLSQDNEEINAENGEEVTYSKEA